jgi:hypothetical protein
MNQTKFFISLGLEILAILLVLIGAFLLFCTLVGWAELHFEGEHYPKVASVLRPALLASLKHNMLWSRSFGSKPNR